jgi:hypothetical protein
MLGRPNALQAEVRVRTADDGHIHRVDPIFRFCQRNEVLGICSE